MVSCSHPRNWKDSGVVALVTLANDLGEGALAYDIEQTLDEARAVSLFPPNLKQRRTFRDEKKGPGVTRGLPVSLFAALLAEAQSRVYQLRSNVGHSAYLDLKQRVRRNPYPI
jgi:hypothetical protein